MNCSDSVPQCLQACPAVSQLYSLSKRYCRKSKFYCNEGPGDGVVELKVVRGTQVKGLLAVRRVCQWEGIRGAKFDQWGYLALQAKTKVHYMPCPPNFW